LHISLDRVDVLLFFLFRIGVVEAQPTNAAEFFCQTKVQADRTGVADVQIAVRLRRKRVTTWPCCAPDSICSRIMLRTKLVLAGLLSAAMTNTIWRFD